MYFRTVWIELTEILKSVAVLGRFKSVTNCKQSPSNRKYVDRENFIQFNKLIINSVAFKMCSKVNLDEIRNIDQDEFKEILHAWINQKDYAKKLRKELVMDFGKTSLAKRLEVDNQKNMFNSKDYVIDTLQAEHLYSQNNHFTLSIFFTETKHPTLLPNLEKDQFRFEKNEIKDLVGMLGKLADFYAFNLLIKFISLNQVWRKAIKLREE
jgi:hypothetical protein